MKILVTNDDGVYAPGLWAAVRALHVIGEVVVVAPDREQSGVGPAVTLNNPVRATQVVPMVEGIEVHAVEGSPADSVILALETIVGNVDIVIAGINNGANLGEDVLVSGTVGAAMQGYYRGVTSIAVSVASLRGTRFDAAAQLVAVLVQQMRHSSLAKGTLLNVNLPALGPEQINGIQITRLGSRTYADTVRHGDDGKRKYYWITRTRPAWDMEEGTDVWSIRHKYASITPLQAMMSLAPISPDLEALPGRLAHAFSEPNNPK